MQLGEVAAVLGSKAILLTGGSSLAKSGRLDRVRGLLGDACVDEDTFSISQEPAPEQINRIVAEARGGRSELVIAIGGGSVLDAGKAVSAMVTQEFPVEDYLEGVGNRVHDGRKLPFIAIPTTAGTGSEATVNAVLSRVGPGGYKASLRHNNLAADIAVVDPELSLSCPPAVTAACGMDALTQLLEAYVSSKASPMTDAISLSGLTAARDGLLNAFRSGDVDIQARTDMAYASLMSGVALANAGLGVVHGLAGVLGGLYPAPHGVICGTLVAAATRMNIAKCKEVSDAALHKYAAVGRVFGADSDDGDMCCAHLVETLELFAQELALPRLGSYGVDESAVREIAKCAGDKNNPVKWTVGERESLLLERL